MTSRTPQAAASFAEAVARQATANVAMILRRIAADFPEPEMATVSVAPLACMDGARSDWRDMAPMLCVALENAPFDVRIYEPFELGAA